MAISRHILSMLKTGIEQLYTSCATKLTLFVNDYEFDETGNLAILLLEVNFSLPTLYVTILLPNFTFLENVRILPTRLGRLPGT